MRGRLLTLIMTNAVLIVGCATGAGLTRGDVVGQYGVIAELSDGVASAEAENAALLAPEHYERTQTFLAEAIEHARNGRRAEALASANRGNEALGILRERMTAAGDVFAEVLTTRARAVHEGAATSLADDFGDADERFRETTRMFERGRVDDARERRPTLMNAYAELELQALRKNTREAASAAIARAVSEDADDHAPQTLDQAREELRLAEAVLDADRTERERAERHARRAIWLASRARAITELSKMFDNEDFSNEDFVLWHQRQLSTIAAPVRDSLPFDEGDRAAVLALRRDVESLLGALQESRATARSQERRIDMLSSEVTSTRQEYEQHLAALVQEHRQQLERLEGLSEDELAAVRQESAAQLAALTEQYEGQLSAETQAAREAERQRQESERRFNDVGALFRSDEATVVRQGADLRLDIYGFSFPPGGTEIGAANYGILDRVVTAINMFPGARVRVIGHTDSTGGERRNIGLSVERANHVTRFLTEVGGVAPDRVESTGYGEARPVASNDSQEGRAMNRRIEILIIGAAGP